MNIKQLGIAAALLCASVGSAHAAATVTFVKPDTYTDMPHAPQDRERVLKELSEHFTKAQQKLAPGAELKVDVLDLDLAGRINPFTRGNDDIRILHGGADWPTMHVRFSLERDGKVLAAGDDRMSNMNYLQRQNHYLDGDTLRYEKQMIDDWLKAKMEASKQVATR